MKIRVVLFIAMACMVLLILSPILAEPEPIDTDPLHTSDNFSWLGYHALKEYLAQATEVRTQRGPEMTIDRPTLWIIAEPLASYFNAQLDKALAEDPAYIVIVLPKWRGTADDQGFVNQMAPVRDTEITDTLATLGWDLLVAAISASEFTDGTHTNLLHAIEATDDIAPLVGNDTHTLIGEFSYSAAKPTMILITDPDLVNNQGFQRGTASLGAEFLYKLVVDNELRVVFDDHVHGFGQAEPFWHALGRFPLALLPLHVAVMIGLLLWAFAGSKTLPAPDPVDASREQQLVRTTASLLTAPRHHEALVTEYLAACRADATHGQLVNDDALTRLEAGARTATSHVELLRDATRMRPGAALRIIFATHRWRQELTGKQGPHV